MTSGTRIVLATAVLFVGILIVYYGFVMPGADPEPAAGTLASDTPVDLVVEPAPGHPSMPTGVATAVPASTRVGETGRTLGPGSEAGTEHVRPVRPERTTPAAAPGMLPAAATAVHESPAVRPQPHRPGPGAAGTRSTTPSARGQGTLARNTAETLTPPAPLPVTTRFYTVEEGDTLSDIAATQLGDARRWREIAQLNKINPDRLRIGQRLRLPASRARTTTATTAPPRRPNATTARVHTVGRGDTLSRIARHYYGDRGQWAVIYEANRRRLGGDPDALVIGMRITIPAPPR